MYPIYLCAGTSAHMSGIAVNCVGSRMIKVECCVNTAYVLTSLHRDE